MQIFIIAVGNRMPDWVDSAFCDYVKRMPAECSVKLCEIRPVERGSTLSPEKAMLLEMARIETELPKRARLGILDEHGRDLTSVALARQLEQWQFDGRDVALVIGGADGIAPPQKQRAEFTLRLSSMTLPHGLARVVLAEQLYRASTILRNHPYHRV